MIFAKYGKHIRVCYVIYVILLSFYPFLKILTINPLFCKKSIIAVQLILSIYFKTVQDIIQVTKDKLKKLLLI
ncbi:hypothetical protein BHO_0127900 (plasmid) [Borrelia hermsii YBT]|uniref:Uncharacterized protein n=1 Tax=Borrelia hermsii YBT TaxID=1313295 RepID=W5T2E3_BORHE|nr:hypothetical protein BHO_0127900 [Borrelia hermsii YBT]